MKSNLWFLASVPAGGVRVKITSITLVGDADVPVSHIPSCRIWRGGGDLRASFIGCWNGTNIRGTVGRHEGKYDKKFANWCLQHDVLFIRTVDLFWAFDHYRNGFFRSLSISKLRERWEHDTKLIRSLQRQVGYDNNGHPQFKPLSSAERAEFRKRWGLGAWKSYHQRHRTYFSNESARYKRVLNFWQTCGEQGRRNFHRCTRYSIRQADAHPDYLVALRDTRGRVVDFGFVEVKGPRESLRPSQKKFFPELVRCAGQRVWLARFSADGNRINFGEFTATGEVRPCGILQSKSVGQFD